MNHSSDSWKLPEGQASKLFLLPHISLELKRELLKISDSISLTKQSLLFLQGEAAEHFYMIINGAVKLVKQGSSQTDTGQTVLSLLGPGELIGVALMLDATTQNTYPVSAKTLGPTEVLRFSKSSFHEFWIHHPELMQLTHKTILARMGDLQNDRCIQKFNLEQKIAYFMTEKWFNSKNIRITRKDIADCVGASQEAVIRLLNDWARMNLISNENREIKLRNIEAIRLLWKPN